MLVSVWYSLYIDGLLLSGCIHNKQRHHGQEATGHTLPKRTASDG